MLVEENQYVIANLKDSPKAKNFLARVEKVKKEDGKRRYDVIAVRDEYPSDSDADKVTIRASNILINLGDKPAPGKVYGVDVANYYRKSVRHEFWGPVHLMAEMPDGFLKQLRPAMDAAEERLTKLGLAKVSSKFETELRHGGGKYAGMYHWKNTPLEETYTDRLILYPNIIVEAKGMTLEQILFHEFGHNVRHNLLRRPTIFSAWIRAFNKTVDVQVFSMADFKKHLHRMIKLLHKEEIKTLQDYAKRFKGEEGDNPVEIALLKAALRYMHQVHRVGAREVNALLAADKTDLLEAIWPATDVDTSELEPIVSEYATKNVEELFAESFMFYCSKAKKLPKSINELMEKSLTVAKDEAK